MLIEHFDELIPFIQSSLLGFYCELRFRGIGQRCLCTRVLLALGNTNKLSEATNFLITANEVLLDQSLLRA